MHIDQPLFDKPFQVVSDQGDCVSISTLDKGCAMTHAALLVSIHDRIPFVHWTADDFLSDQLGPRVFHHKWDLSIVITAAHDQPVGFLVSYLRPPDSTFDGASVYMHRMAIVPTLQRRSIGRQVISIYLRQIFAKLPVDWVTLQTNDTIENIRITALYESLGFTKIKRVFYPEKTDWFMARPRSSAADSPGQEAK